MIRRSHCELVGVWYCCLFVDRFERLGGVTDIESAVDLVYDRALTDTRKAEGFILGGTSVFPTDIRCIIMIMMLVVVVVVVVIGIGGSASKRMRCIKESGVNFL